ncbi:3-methyladenine DNA glycosylase [Kocuria sp. TGY1127_2]|uniref:3-methyladenine DNA glycosylase n=1 Tax=Kocuria sp. TGY1127_2 TaxID=2711328 RepID=UPI0035300ABB
MSFTSSTTPHPGPVHLTGPVWRDLAEDHRERAAIYTEPFLERRHHGRKHPVEDFLFTYYTLKPGQLTRWHPGPWVILLDAADRLEWKFYRRPSITELQKTGLSPEEARIQRPTAATVDVEAFLEARSTAVVFTQEILSRTVSKPGNFGCFGMHEWAMAYRSEENDIRHEYLDLRLGADGTDSVVETHRIHCTHFDAFRFFQPQAVPRNEIQPTREQQRSLEQPGCLHANMDVYKWAYKLLPFVDSALLMDCFDLAWQVREMDMRAAPYDLKSWGYEPIPVETARGKKQYATLQREFAERSIILRQRLMSTLDRADSTLMS